jgi:long-chain acyl-CoA synthetase
VPASLPFDPDLPEYPTVIHALADAVRRIPDQPAIWCEDDGLSYRQYLRCVAGYARLLAERGVAGRRVAHLMGNSIEVAVASLGAQAARAQSAPMNAAYPPAGLEPLLRDVDPLVLTCDAGSATMGRALAAKLGIPHLDVFAPGELTLDVWRDDESLTLPEPLPRADDPSLIFFTGGTTGTPKGADHVHANEMAYARSVSSAWNYGRDRARTLDVAPNFHIWGYCNIVVSPVYLGAAVDVVRAYKPEIVLQRFEDKKISVFAGGPSALYVGLRAHERFKTTDFSNLEYCLAGGAPCSDALLRGWEEDTGCAIYEGWGMSEGAPINSNPFKGVRKVGSVGPNCAGTEVELVDLETGTAVVPTGERGEVRVRGPQFIKSYLNRPEETAATIRDGWLYTGDIGRFDEDGYLYLVDRKKEMILVGGYNVYPREVDEVLVNHPAVMEAAAVAAPDDFRGETVRACVALKPGAEATADELIAWCAERLVKYKVPTVVDFFEALPKSGAGKIDKLSLRGLR